jgi:tetratricopeptide (TPR) repeat protein
MSKASLSKISRLALVVLLFPLCPLFAQESSPSEELSVEEIAKTEAAKHYVSKNYAASLAEFEKLEAQYPVSILVKRYMASLHDSLRQWDQAERKLKQALAIQPDDLISRQMLGDLSIKRADLTGAAREFQYIRSHAPPKSPESKYAEKKLEEIQILRESSQGKAKDRIPAEEFMKSPAAKAFSGGRFEEAVKEFDALLRRYPGDPLIRRFKGVAFLRMNETDKAIGIFSEILKDYPDNIAAHFYLGQAYMAKNKSDEGRKEFQWVIARDKGDYALRSQRAIFQSLGKGPKPKKWTINAIAGYEYDTNATYKSRDTNFSVSGDQNSGRYNTILAGTYQLAQKGRLTLTGDGFYVQSLYDHFPNLQTYTPGFGISGLYSFSLFKKPAFFNLRNGDSITFLKNKFYVFSNTVSPSLIFIPHPKVRVTLGYRFAYNQFENRGIQSGRTNRSGFTNAPSLTNIFYLNDQRNFYVTLGYDYERGDSIGMLYIKNAHGATAGLHFPILEKIEGEVNLRFKNSDYPKSDLPLQRNDTQYTMSFLISRPLNSWLKLTGSYLFEDVNARDNVYEYYKSVFGVQLDARY